MKNARQHPDRALASKVADEKSPAPVIPTDEDEIASLIADLAAPEAGRRLQARKRLVSLRKRPVPNLIEAMSDPQPRVRWEAMKILSLTADPMAAQALVGALEDDNEDVRWLAGMGLVALRQAGLRPLLRAAGGPVALVSVARRRASCLLRAGRQRNARIGSPGSDRA